ncbi:MAG: serine O-acetyltransferase [Clostridia bacterium]|nr:serine O-acetyltransferase [Clostridia bacterium]
MNYNPETNQFEITVKLEGPIAETACRAVRDIRSDIDVIMARDPAARSRLEVLLLYSGLHARIMHRISHALHLRGCNFSARAVSQFAKFLTGIEIHPGATIGKGLFIDHGTGVVIGETAVIGDNCTIYQGVTLGGTGKQTGKRHPTLGDNVMVGAGAKCLGNFTIGSNSKIAAGAVVLGDVPENCTAVGIPAHVVKKDGERIAKKDEADLDQIHIPDPIETEIEALCARIHALEEAVCSLPIGDAEEAEVLLSGEEDIG